MEEFNGVPDDRIVPGSVVQIIENHGRVGWIGAFVLVEEVKTWGVIGFVNCLGETHESPPKCAYIRLKWLEIEFVGQAPLITPDIKEGPLSNA